MAEYIEAQKELEGARVRQLNAEKDYQAQLDVTTQKEEAVKKAYEDYLYAMESGADHYAVEYAAQMYALAQQAFEGETELLGKKKTAYDEAEDDFYNYTNTIIDYETAQQLSAEGNYTAVKDILLKKGEAFGDYSAEVDEETARVLNTLELEAITAGEKAKKFKREFEAGSSNYTEEMVKEAEEGYEEALSKFSTAYTDAFGLGESFGQGIADGIKIKNGAVGAAAIAQIRAAVNAAKKEAEINSPSKKTMKVGEGLGEGAEVGIEKKTPDIKRAASDQMSAILDSYRARESNAQQALRNVAEQQAARTTAGQMTAATANSGMLDQILSTLREGQVLLLDGDTLVGGTANKMDSNLGQLRVLTERGAR